MVKGGYFLLPDGTKKFFYQFDRQKYVCAFLFVDAVAIAADTFTFASVRLSLPDFRLVRLQDIYIHPYVNRGTDVIIPDSLSLLVTDENQYPFDTAGALPGTVTRPAGENVFGFRSVNHIQNIGMRFIYPPTIPGPGPAFTFTMFYSAGLLIADAPVLRATFIFEDYNAVE